MITIIITALVAGPVGAVVALALTRPRFRALEAETDQHAADAATALQEAEEVREELQLSRRAAVVQMLRAGGEADRVWAA